MVDRNFEEANKKVHPVEDQWHYPILTKYGYEPVTKEAVGFVRSYDYTHPATRHTIRCCTGYSSDYWRTVPFLPESKQGYWSDLEPYLKELS